MPAHLSTPFQSQTLPKAQTAPEMEIEELRQPPQPNPNAGLFSCFDNRTPWDMPAPNNDPEAEKENVITEAAI